VYCCVFQEYVNAPLMVQRPEVSMVVQSEFMALSCASAAAQASATFRLRLSSCLFALAPQTMSASAAAHTRPQPTMRCALHRSISLTLHNAARLSDDPDPV
jgi:hypothetical protein